MVDKIFHVAFRYSLYLMVLSAISVLGAALISIAAQLLFKISNLQTLQIIFFSMAGLIVLGVVLNWKKYTDGFDIDLLRAKKIERDRKRREVREDNQSG